MSFGKFSLFAVSPYETLFYSTSENGRAIVRHSKFFKLAVSVLHFIRPLARRLWRDGRDVCRSAQQRAGYTSPRLSSEALKCGASPAQSVNLRLKSTVSH